MSLLFNAFLEIALMRRRPQEVPASVFLLAGTLAVYIVLDVAAISIYRDNFRDIFVQVLADLSLFLAFFWVLLVMFGRRERFLQTATAIAGFWIVLTLVALPIMVWFQLVSDNMSLSVLPLLLIRGIQLWSILVTANIVRYALEIPFFGGVAISLAYVMISLWVMGLLITGPA